jgi:hypothetical protein
MNEPKNECERCGHELKARLGAWVINGVEHPIGSPIPHEINECIFWKLDEAVGHLKDIDQQTFDLVQNSQRRDW